MKVVLVMATSLNGLIARDNGEEDWLPSEGWDEVLVDAGAFGNIVMGRETYELVQKLYASYNFDNVETGYKVIVTANQNFEAGEGYVVVHSPEEAVSFLAAKGFEELLLIGGGKLNTEFIKRQLVNEIWLTINPYIIGQGRPFISPAEFDLPLKLFESQPLARGRIRVKYTVR